MERISIRPVFLFLVYHEIFVYNFCVCLSLSLLACDSENESQEGGKQPETPEDSVCEILWDNSHSYFMGLKGSPVE